MAKTTTLAQNMEDARRERIASFLISREFQDYAGDILKRHFPRFDPRTDTSQEAVTLKLLHRDAAESFLERLYEGLNVHRQRVIITPKQLIR